MLLMFVFELCVEEIVNLLYISTGKRTHQDHPVVDGMAVDAHHQGNTSFGSSEPWDLFSVHIHLQFGCIVCDVQVLDPFMVKFNLLQSLSDVGTMY